MRSAALTCLLALAGCEGGEATLIVELRTDYVGGEEITRAELMVDGEPMPFTRALTLEDDLAAGARVAEVTGLPTGSRELSLSLLAADGSPVARRQLVVQLSQATVATVLVTRNCEGVTCEDPSRPACVDAQCVPAGCVLEDPETCDVGDCATIFCDASAPCVDVMCEAGFCIQTPRDERCDPTEYCRSDTGCAPRTVAADAGPGAVDGGTSDAGTTDAGPLDAGTVAMTDGGPVGVDGGVPPTCTDPREPNDTQAVSADNPVANSFQIGSAHNETGLNGCPGDVDWITLSTVGTVQVRASMTSLDLGGSAMICLQLFTWSQLQRTLMSPPAQVAAPVCAAAGSGLSVGPASATLDGGENYVMLKVTFMGTGTVAYDVDFTGSLT